MKTLKPEYKRVDDRGTLYQLSTGNWKQTNILMIREGKTFGGHYHKNRTELFYVICGHVVLNNCRDLHTGDMILIEPGDKHSFTAKKFTFILELLSEPYNEEDTWK